MRRNRQRDRGQQPRDLHERHRVELNRAGVQRQHDRVAIAQQDAEIAPIRGIAGERQQLARLFRQPVFVQVLPDSRPCLVLTH